MPIATYQLYAFLIPAVSEQHHRSLRPLTLMIPTLFIVGAVFAWFLVVPPTIGFLVGYNDQAFNYQLRAKDYVQFVLLTLLAMGLVFEMPAVMLVLARLRIMSSALMRRHWRASIVALAVLAMLLSRAGPRRRAADAGRRVTVLGGAGAALALVHAVVGNPDQLVG
jgi:sec-independent protein translocase protein TatC